MSPNLRDLALEEAVLKTLSEKVGDALKGHRTTVQEVLEDSDVEKQAVRLPDGTKVASIIAVNPDAKPEVENEKKFIDWVAETHPDEVVERTVVVREVRPAYQTALFAEMTKRKANETVLETGEIVTVPGITMKEGTRTHQVRFEDGDASRDAIAAAYRSNQFAHLTGLRAITAGGDQ